MTQTSSIAPVVARSAPPEDGSFWALYARIVRALVYALVVTAAAGILAMMTVTCVEIVLRIFGKSLTGVLDIVKICGAISTAGALPYTTACKGHVAIEFFFQKLSRPLRAVVDALSRLCVLGLFGFLAFECVQYGMALRDRGQVTPTLQVPEFWVPFVLAASCSVVCLVKVYHLFHPGKELIKP